MFGRDYQLACQTTEIYTHAAEEFIDAIYESGYRDDGDLNKLYNIILELMYCAGKLNGEAGEIAEKVFKTFREYAVNDVENIDALKDKLFYELGDVLWYIASICNILNLSMDDVMLANIEKLQDRKKRGVIHGSGDNR